MERRPTGPRTRGAAPPPPSQKGRDEAFSDIFGKRNTHHLHSQQQSHPPVSLHQQQRAYPGQYPPQPPQQTPYGARPQPPPQAQQGNYDVYAGSVGVGLPPGAGTGAPYPVYGYPQQQHPPSSMGYDRRVSVTPSNYSSGSSSLSHGQQQQSSSSSSSSYLQPGQQPPSRNPSVHQQQPPYYPQGQAQGGLAPMYSSSSPNLSIPNQGVQRSRTQSSQRSANPQDGWEGAPPPPAGQAYGGAPAGAGGGLTPAQAYQAQVGEGGAGAAQFHRPGAYQHAPHTTPTQQYHPSPSPSSNSSYSNASPNSQINLSPPPTHPRLPPTTSAPSYASSQNGGGPPPRLPTFENAMGDGLGLSDLPGINFDEMAAGTVTPRPSQVNDDSELGYLASGSGNASGASSIYSARDPSIRSSHTRTPSESSTRSGSTQNWQDNNNQRSGFQGLSRIDTTFPPLRSISPGHSSPSSTLGGGDPIYRRHTGGRDSVDSSRSMPAQLQRGSSSVDLRSSSFSSNASRPDPNSTASLRSVSRASYQQPPLPALPPSSYNFPNTPGSPFSSKRPGSITPATRKHTHVNPAFLSKVGEAFRNNIVLSERVKDGLAYKEAFDGREAVDLIAEIIKTSDRNLALLLGRALDAQKFFHDVTYDHRLRDSSSELYQFKEKLMIPGAPSFGTSEFVVGSGTPPGDEDGSASLHDMSASSILLPPSSNYASSFQDGSAGSPLTPLSSSNDGGNLPPPPPPHLPRTQTAGTTTSSLPPHSPGSITTTGLETAVNDENSFIPTGVFTLLLDCYSPTCSNTSLCYSIACPRRLEQAKRLNLKPQPGLKKTVSAESLKEENEGTGATLWANSVSKAVLETVGVEERKRQEAINELIFTERDFVRDLEYLRDLWIKPLRTGDIIQPNERRDTFVTQVFWNVSSILANNAVLSDLLTKRQRSQPIVQTIGDILLERVPLFQPFVDYGGHQQYGKHEFEKEKLDNPEFVKFVDEVERRPESRKIELNGFLTRPTTRLGRYPLLLKAILKATPEDNPDHELIPKVLKLFDDFLDRVNTAAGKTQNRMDLAHLDSQLRPNEAHELRLSDENRELIHKGQLKRRGGTQSETADLEVYLLDNVLVLARYKIVNKTEELRLYKRPIPLELLTMVTQDESYNLSKYGIRPKSLLNRTSTSKSGSGTTTNNKPEKEGKHGFSITFNYLGRRGYSLTLWSASHIQRKKWCEVIDKQQQMGRERNKKLDFKTLETIFTGPNKVNCAAPYDAGRRMIYGTDDGVYFSNLTEPDRPPVMVLSLLDVTQVDILEQFQLLIVLSERSVQTFPLDSLDPKDPTAALKRGKRISSHTTFFKAGQCLGRTIVCIVKSSPLSTTIKTMDPVEAPVKKKPQGAAFSKLMPSRHDTLKVFKEFYIPTESSSIHFLKTRLCIGCTKGFEIVDLETLDTQGLLDPADPNLELVHRRDNQRPVRPMAIYRIEGDFLLCYDDFAFYVNKNGWRTGGPKNRDDVRWRITWEGSPTSFALHYPWVMAFDNNFVEIWNVNTGVFTQVIQGSNIKLLFADTPPSAVNSAAQLHQQQVQQQQRLAYARGAPPYGYPPYQQHQQHQNGGGMPMRGPPPPMRMPPPPPPPNPRSQIVLYIDEKVVSARLAEH